MAKVSTPTDTATGAVYLDTLAQLRKVSNDGGCTASQISFQKRSQAKLVTDAFIFPLIDLKSPLTKSYWQTYHCTRTLFHEGGNVKTRYCNQRFCLVCNRIRTARLINGYGDQLQSLVNPYMVTLTTRNVDAPDLKETINGMLKDLTRCKDKMRKNGVKLIGIRKIEVTYNSETQQFHPHYHLIVDGCVPSFRLVAEWIKQRPETTNVKGQHITHADVNAPSELFKYFTKMLNKDGSFTPEAMDVVFRAMKRKRTFQPFGGIKRCSEDVEVEQEHTIDWKPPQTEIWIYEKANEHSDWYNASGEAFSEVQQTERTMALVNKINPNYFTDTTDFHKLETKQQQNQWQSEDENHNPTQKPILLQHDLTTPN